MTEPFGKSLVSRKKFLRLLGLPGEKGGLRSGLVVLPAGKSIGEHNTDEKKEILVILRGKARVYFGKKKMISLSAPGFIFIPPKTPHDVKNIGRNNLKYVYITSSKE